MNSGETDDYLVEYYRAYNEESDEGWSDDEDNDEVFDEALQQEAAAITPPSPSNSINYDPLISSLLSDETDERPSAFFALSEFISLQCYLNNYNNKPERKDIVQSASTFDHGNLLGYLFAQSNAPFTNSETMNTLVISESHLIREILHMLRGVDGAVFMKDPDTRFVVSKRIAVSSLTIESLNSMLTHFMNIGTTVVQIQSFIQRIFLKSSMSQTIQAFCHAVHSKLEREFSKLVHLEYKHTNSHQLSLLQLIFATDEYKQKINIIWSIISSYVDYMNQFPHDKNYNSLEAAFILSRMYTDLGELELVPERFSGQYRFLASILSDTIKPYLRLLDNWMFSSEDYSHTLSFDMNNEFLIQAQEDVLDMSDERYWECGFTLREIAHRPNFLLANGDEILRIGKSLRMIIHIDKRKRAYSISVNTVPDFTVFERERKSLIELHEYWTNTAAQIEVPATNEVIEHRNEEEEDVEMREGNTAKQVDTIAFKPIETTAISSLLLQTLEKNSSASVQKVRKDDKLDDNSDEQYIHSIDSIIQRSIIEEVDRRSTYVCRHLVNMLIDDCKLLPHLTAIRAFFLMEAGDIMEVFATRLFDTMEYDNLWNSRDMTIMLNNALQETLKLGMSVGTRRYNFASNSKTYSYDIYSDLDLLDRLSVVVTKKNDSLNIYDALQLQYALDQPLNTLITSDCMQCYNEAFNFNLRIKHAKYLIERLYLPRNQSSFKRLFHKLQLLLAKLKHFVGNVQHYVMTRVLHSIWNELLENVTSKAKNFDEVKQFHLQYIARIQERCLLKKASFVMNQISKMLDMCTRVRSQYNLFMEQYNQHYHLKEEEVDSLNQTYYTFTTTTSEKRKRQEQQQQQIVVRDIVEVEQQVISELDSIDDEFTKSLKMLLTILRSILQRGQHDHLQDLNNRLNFNYYYHHEE